MVQLQPKTYCCFPRVTPDIAAMTQDIMQGTQNFNIEDAEEYNDPCKRSTKGCSKRLNPYSPLAFMDVLRTKKSLTATNKGFLCRNRKVYATTLNKDGPGYLYVKRQVQANHTSTTMLPELE